ncbi:hypothetical protein NK6_2955 [Bradyrhizobium diazoefficiens]|uniref:Uncharacterized protein n=1 Tax=Bradyrhizobium diazoefficiens TaxID=1355477 RepID=A0A0E3VTR8_9BRAD|nr:hypothetical protein NK6_2955 [Bradyrhizobium diazoefficiens]
MPYQAAQKGTHLDAARRLGFTTESYAVSALYTTLASLSGASYE